MSRPLPSPPPGWGSQGMLLTPPAHGPKGQEVKKHPVLQFLRPVRQILALSLKTSLEGASHFSVTNRGPSVRKQQTTCPSCSQR